VSRYRRIIVDDRGAARHKADLRAVVFCAAIYIIGVGLFLYLLFRVFR
jgi:hypothetical protein